MNMTTTDFELVTKFTSDFPACPACLSPIESATEKGFYENKASCSRQCMSLQHDNTIRFEPEDDGLALYYIPAQSRAEVRTASYPVKTMDTIPNLSYSEFQEKVLTYRPIRARSRLGRYFSRPLSIDGMSLSEVVRDILDSY